MCLPTFFIIYTKGRTGIAPPDNDCTIDEYDRFWERIRNEKHFYEGLTPLPGSLEMVKSLYETYGNICEIVSETHYITGLNLMKSFWVEDANVYAAKTEWVQKFLAMDIKSDWRFGEAVNCFDATTDPPRGRHYREQGILAYDDTDEVVILGIKDSKAEVVEIPREINGKPVTVLNERCFANCSESLRKVILPDTLKEIGDYAFEYCEKLEKPEIPASVTKIGKDLFRFVSHDIKS